MEVVTLQDLVKDIAEQMNDLVTGTTTGGTGLSTFSDSGFGWLTTGVNLWSGSEVLFEEPAYTAGGNINGNQVHWVSSMASNVFTVTPALRASGTIGAGIPWFMVRVNGRGNHYRTYLAALRYAMDQLNITGDATDSSLVTAASTYDYTIPSTFGGLYKVELVKSGQTTLQLTPRDWEMRPGRILHISNANVYVAYGFTLTLTGITVSPVPTTLNGTVTCERAPLVDVAVEYLQRKSVRPADNQRASQRQQERLRFNRLLPRPNLRMVIP